MLHIPLEEIGDGKEWTTRLRYLAATPYQRTLALDSQVVACDAQITQVLGVGPEATPYQEWDSAFDFAFQTGRHYVYPHNWALLYTWNKRTELLFERWLEFQVHKATDVETQDGVLMLMMMIMQ